MDQEQLCSLWKAVIFLLLFKSRNWTDKSFPFFFSVTYGDWNDDLNTNENFRLELFTYDLEENLSGKWISQEYVNKEKAFQGKIFTLSVVQMSIF